MDDIIEEYRVFVSQKLQMIDTIKNINKQLLDKMEEIQFPKLKKLFIKIGNIENDNEFKCSFCSIWSGKNKASLAAHIRNCKLNPKNKDSAIIDEVIELIPSVVPDLPIIEPTKEKSIKKSKK